jgi:hypothetical protein
VSPAIFLEVEVSANSHDYVAVGQTASLIQVLSWLTPVAPTHHSSAERSMPAKRASADDCDPSTINSSGDRLMIISGQSNPLAHTTQIGLQCSGPPGETDQLPQSGAGLIKLSGIGMAENCRFWRTPDSWQFRKKTLISGKDKYAIM